VPIEAMASGCIVVGFHGYGGMEYAGTENGFWFSPEFLEEVVDALAAIANGLEGNDAKLAAMREAGFATAARYTPALTKEALARAYAAAP
jgi:glycosyltransferase involved in cell wall biosynthesis